MSRYPYQVRTEKLTKGAERLTLKTTVAVTRKTRLVMEIIKNHLQSPTMDDALLRYFSEHTPEFVTRAETADQILSTAETDLAEMWDSEDGK